MQPWEDLVGIGELLGSLIIESLGKCRSVDRVYRGRLVVPRMSVCGMKGREQREEGMLSRWSVWRRDGGLLLSTRSRTRRAEGNVLVRDWT